MSNEPMLCPLTGAYCTEAGCPLYHVDTLQCEFVMAIKNILGGYTPASKQAPVRTRPSQLVPKSLKPFPTLESGKYLQEITGEVVGDVEVREVNTKSGPKPIANFYLTDGQSKVRVALWEAFSKEAEKLKSGDVITLKGMSIRPPYKGEEQISSTKNTEVL